MCSRFNHIYWLDYVPCVRITWLSTVPSPKFITINSTGYETWFLFPILKQIFIQQQPAMKLDSEILFWNKYKSLYSSWINLQHSFYELVLWLSNGRWPAMIYSEMKCRKLSQRSREQLLKSRRSNPFHSRRGDWKNITIHWVRLCMPVIGRLVLILPVLNVV
jgi:hypothetical protein